MSEIISPNAFEARLSDKALDPLMLVSDIAQSDLVCTGSGVRCECPVRVYPNGGRRCRGRAGSRGDKGGRKGGWSRLFKPEDAQAQGSWRCLWCRV